MVASIKADVEDIRDDIKDNKDWLKNLSNQFFSTVVKVSAMNTTMEKFMKDETRYQIEINQKKIDNIFQVTPLKLADYEKDDNEKPRYGKNGHVTKWYNIKNKFEEFAFKVISNKEIQKVQNQVTILKELHDWQNIIKFWGIVNEGYSCYLVVEWAEYGNLREYYRKFEDRFDLKLKLRISLDIARGLNFLRTVEVIITSF
jgi:serine/threonine protein kinase